MDMVMFVNGIKKADIKGKDIAKFCRDNHEVILNVVMKKLNKRSTQKEMQEVMMKCSLSWYCSSILKIDVQDSDVVTFKEA